MAEITGKTLVAAAVLVSIVAAACSNGSRGDQAGTSNASGPNLEGRCDLGFNTAKYNDIAGVADPLHEHHTEPLAADFTVEEWAQTFVDEDLGQTVEQVVDDIEADDIYRRHIAAGVLTPTLGPEAWIPMSDPSECDRLARELGAARAAASRYPTVADAVAAGYWRGDAYAPGLGVHYQDLRLDDTFDPSTPSRLLYDGTDADATVVGLAYVVFLPGDVPPEGFTGSNDRWHRHRGWCVDGQGVVLAADILDDQECVDLGGTPVANAGSWMLHAWVVPGCESGWGVFSHANPRLPYLPAGTALATGCGSGKVTTDALGMDDRGAGARIGE